jgi:hypothetical protein
MDELRWAARVLKMTRCRWLSTTRVVNGSVPEEWRRRQVARICEEYREGASEEAAAEAEEQANFS